MEIKEIHFNRMDSMETFLLLLNFRFRKFPSNNCLPLHCASYKIICGGNNRNENILSFRDDSHIVIVIRERNVGIAYLDGSQSGGVLDLRRTLRLSWLLSECIHVYIRITHKLRRLNLSMNHIALSFTY